MKYNIISGILTLEPETINDFKEVIKLHSGKQKRKHDSKLKTCGKCSGKFKGTMGLSIHTVKAH